MTNYHDTCYYEPIVNVPHLDNVEMVLKSFVTPEKILYLKCEAGFNEMQIFDFSGRIIYQAQFAESVNNYSLNISGWTKGLYIVRIGNSVLYSIKKIIN